MSEIRIRVSYERPHSETITLNVPDDLEYGTDPWNDWIYDNIPCVEAFPEDWELW